MIHMQTVATPLEAEVEIPRKVWTREEAHALLDLGFPNADRLELINGDLINHMGKKHPHILWQTLLGEWLRTVFGVERVLLESPTEVAAQDMAHNEPEPDLLVTGKSIREYTSTPLPSDLLLVVEIADSTLRFDLRVKGALYARAGIIEYWVVDIQQKQLIVHRSPKEGRYTSVMAYRFDEEVSPLAAPDAKCCLDLL